MRTERLGRINIIIYKHKTKAEVKVQKHLQNRPFFMLAKGIIIENIFLTFIRNISLEIFMRNISKSFCLRGNFATNRRRFRLGKSTINFAS